MTGQDRAAQHRTGHDRTGRDRTGKNRTGHDKTGQGGPGKDRTGQRRIGQGTTGQDGTGHAKTGQDRTGHTAVARYSHPGTRHRSLRIPRPPIRPEGSLRTALDTVMPLRQGPTQSAKTCLARHLLTLASTSRCTPNCSTAVNRVVDASEKYSAARVCDMREGGGRQEKGRMKK